MVPRQTPFRHPAGFRDRPKRWVHEDTSEKDRVFVQFQTLIQNHRGIQKGSDPLLPSVVISKPRHKCKTISDIQKGFITVPLFNQSHITKSKLRVTFKRGLTLLCWPVTNSRLWFLISILWFFVNVFDLLSLQRSLLVHLFISKFLTFESLSCGGFIWLFRDRYPGLIDF